MKKNALFILIALAIALFAGYFYGNVNPSDLFNKAMDTAVVLDQIEETTVETGVIVETGSIEEIVASSENTVSEYGVVELKDNASSEVFRKKTGVNYMDALNATTVKLPEGTTEAILGFSLDITGDPTYQYWRTTFNITIGYFDCKYDVAFNSDNIAYGSGIVYAKDGFPQFFKVDLANLKCADRTRKNNMISYNAIPDLIAGKRVAIYFAKEDGLVKDALIHYR